MPTDPNREIWGRGEEFYLFINGLFFFFSFNLALVVLCFF